MENQFYPEVTFEVKGQKLSGKLYMPQGKGPFPALLIYHGYQGCRQHYGLFARDIVALGIAVFSFNFRGCGRGNSWSEGDIAQQTIGDQLDDALAAYDYLRAQKNINSEQIACFGNSLGGYLGACISATRNFNSLILSAPAIYADEWAKRVIADIPDREKQEYRATADLQKTKAIQAMATFKGSLLVILHEHDTQVPARVPESYFQAAQHAAHRELKFLKDADHQLNESARETRQQWVKDWLSTSHSSAQQL